MAEELWRAHSLEKSKDTDGGETTSGSFSYWADDPKIEFSKHTIGTYFDPITGKSLAGPASNSIKITKVSVTDSVIGMKQGRPFRQWQVTIEGDTTSSGDNSTKATYTLEEYKDDNGLIYRKATMTVINDGDTPIFSVRLGDTFSVLSLTDWQDLKCTRVSGGDEWTDKDVHRWTMSYDGARIAPESGTDIMPKDGDVNDNISYAINGSTARAVNGEFIVLRRSEAPVTKRTIVKYQAIPAQSTTPTAPSAGCEPGDSYPAGVAAPASLGIVTSVKTTKETVKENGIEIGSYYRHDIEVEK